MKHLSNIFNINEQAVLNRSNNAIISDANKMYVCVLWTREPDTDITVLSPDVTYLLFDLDDARAVKNVTDFINSKIKHKIFQLKSITLFAEKTDKPGKIQRFSGIDGRVYFFQVQKLFDRDQKTDETRIV